MMGCIGLVLVWELKRAQFRPRERQPHFASLPHYLRNLSASVFVEGACMCCLHCRLHLWEGTPFLLPPYPNLY
jgi:hypothetical protein